MVYYGHGEDILMPVVDVVEEAGVSVSGEVEGRSQETNVFLVYEADGRRVYATKRGCMKGLERLVTAAYREEPRRMKDLLEKVS